MSEAAAAKAQTGKTGGNFQAPPPDKPKEWKALGVLQYKYSGGVFEFRLVGNIAQEIMEDLHERHGIGCERYG